jgi:hypothetical protein
MIQVVRAKLLMVCNNTKHLVGAYTMGVDWMAYGEYWRNKDSNSKQSWSHRILGQGQIAPFGSSAINKDILLVSWASSVAL